MVAVVLAVVSACIGNVVALTWAVMSVAARWAIPLATVAVVCARSAATSAVIAAMIAGMPVDRAVITAVDIRIAFLG